jgi:hypothetical protein
VVPGLLPSPLPQVYLYAAWAVSGLLALAVSCAFYVLAVRFAGELFKKTDA